jgi:hypothetical protein
MGKEGHSEEEILRAIARGGVRGHGSRHLPQARQPIAVITARCLPIFVVRQRVDSLTAGACDTLFACHEFPWESPWPTYLCRW